MCYLNRVFRVSGAAETEPASSPLVASLLLMSGGEGGGDGAAQSLLRMRSSQAETDPAAARPFRFRWFAYPKYPIVRRPQ